MSAPARPTCEWFLGCRHKAVALVAHPRKPVPTCQECIDRMGLRDKIVAAILEPTGDGAPVVMQVGQHADEHLFHGVCICACATCVDHPRDGVTRCTCPACPDRACGAKAGVA